MRLRWRNKVTPTQDEGQDWEVAKAQESLREAQSALNEVRKKNADGSAIASRLREIRKVNHFGEFWHGGMEGR